MKKIVTLILVVCMVLTLAACADKGSKTSESTKPESTAPQNTTPESTAPQNTAPQNTTPEITPQEVYNAGKSLSALLGNHENVYVRITSNGNLIREEYLSKQHCYSFSGAEYMDMGFEYASFVTEHAECVCFDGIYMCNVMLTPSGMVDMKERFAVAGTVEFVSSEMMKNDGVSISKTDSSIIVTCNADLDEIVLMGEDIVSCVETYTLDATTREMTAIKTVYTYKDGTVEEGVVTITRDVEMPEGMKPFLAYEQETENLRTVTVVSNPGTENEKTESIQVPKGLLVAFSPDWNVEKTLTIYADAACTRVIEEDPDVNSDVTVYIKWND